MYSLDFMHYSLYIYCIKLYYLKNICIIYIYTHIHNPAQTLWEWLQHRRVQHGYLNTDICIHNDLPE